MLPYVQSGVSPVAFRHHLLVKFWLVYQPRFRWPSSNEYLESNIHSSRALSWDLYIENGLYWHQVEALFALASEFLNSTRVTVSMPTGTGKTVVAVLAPYILNAHRVLVVTPNRIISRQIDNLFCNFLKGNNFFPGSKMKNYTPESGFATKNNLPKKVEEGDSLVIINAHMVQTKRTTVKISDLPKDDFDLVIVDEAHHYPAPTWAALIDHFTVATKVLFVTATAPPPGNLPTPCNQQMSREDYEQRGVIRKIKPFFVGERSESLIQAFSRIAKEIVQTLPRHDAERKQLRGHERVFHQAMVLVICEGSCQCRSICLHL